MFKAENRHVNVVTAASVSTLLKKGEKPEEISTETMMNENFNLPIKKGRSGWGIASQKKVIKCCLRPR
ncbi:hypothetical protein RWE15_22135 [Virgibacillus halophilus]|uniref:Uncharacterized protein n=1 Tax=Tigheibacillus halophilus TaxID=361280 RepID=A0ABU5CDA2_9BACI|nr:hypothetical protein [Virgibacillus halophilus]